MRGLLTNSNLVSFDSSRVLGQLQLPSQRSFNSEFIPPSADADASHIRTPSNAAELGTMLKSLDSYSRHYKQTIRKIIKDAKTLNADLHLARDTVRILFKSNLAREARKKKTKELKNIDYNLIISAFGRFFTSAKAQRRRDDEIRKMEKAKQKKKAADVKRATAAQKKQADEAVRKIKRAEKKEKKMMKAEEMIARKRKRKEKKLQKMAEKEAAAGRKKRQKRGTSSIPMDPALQTKEYEERLPSPSLGGYQYPQA